MKTNISTGRHIRRVTALVISTTFLTQSFAWAICADGLPFPAGQQGYVVGALPPTLFNMAPNIFTGTAGSVFIPDNTTNENNDPNGPLTGHGHNWAFDQGSTTCKMTDVGAANQPASSWNIPPNTVTDCFALPIVKGGVFKNFGNIPLQGQSIVPTCDPTLLSTPGVVNPLATRINKLGCQISLLINGPDPVTGLPIAQDTTQAPAYLFIAGIQGGMFAEQLDVVPNNAIGDSGRVISNIRYYSDLPEGSKMTNVAIDSQAHFAMSTSIRRNPTVWGCNNPLGDPGDFTDPLVDTGTFAQSYDPRSGVKCLNPLGQNGLQVTLTNAFGPDDQPYFGGQRTVTSFNPNPGSKFLTTAFPQCIVAGSGIPITLPVDTGNPVTTAANRKQLDAAIKTVFAAHSGNHCGTAIANAGFSAAPVIQPQTLLPWVAANGNMYMFSAGTAQPVVQVRVTQQVGDHSSSYRSRTFASGQSGFVTGLGIANDMAFTGTGSVDTHGTPTPNPAATGEGSLIVMTDPSGLGLAAQEIMTRLPLCSDF